MESTLRRRKNVENLESKNSEKAEIDGMLDEKDKLIHPKYAFQTFFGARILLVRSMAAIYSIAFLIAHTGA